MTCFDPYTAIIFSVDSETNVNTEEKADIRIELHMS